MANLSLKVSQFTTITQFKNFDKKKKKHGIKAQIDTMVEQIENHLDLSDEERAVFDLLLSIVADK